VSVKVDSQELKGPLLFEPVHEFVEHYSSRLQVGEFLVQVNSDGCAKILLTNTSGCTCKLGKGEWLGLAFEAEPITDDAAGRDNGSLNRNNEETPGDGRCEQQATVQVVVTVDQEDSQSGTSSTLLLRWVQGYHGKTRVNYKLYFVSIIVSLP